MMGSRCRVTVIGLLLLAAVAAVLLWVGAAKDPSVKGEGLYVPALDRWASRNGSDRNNTIVMDVGIVNRNLFSSIYYDQGMTFSLYYSDGVVGVVSVPAFYQSRLQTMHKQAVFNGSGSGWEAALRRKADGPTAFSVIVGMVVRYRGAAWNRRKHWAQYSGELIVGVDGRMVG